MEERNMNMELRYGTPKHRKILDAILKRKTFSKNQNSGNIERYNAMEDAFRLYVKATDDDNRREGKKAEGLPDYTTIHVPYTYSIQMAAHTYLANVMLGRSPVFQYTGRHGESEQSTQAVEALTDYQYVTGKLGKSLNNWIFDATKYGVGIVWDYWETEMIRRNQYVMEDETFLGLPTGRKKKVQRITETVGYEGNKLFNVRPQTFLPDPRVPLSDIQSGEFVGRESEIGWNEIIRGGANGRYFNVNALSKNRKSKKEGVTNSDSGMTITLPGDATGEVSIGAIDISDIGFVNLIEMYVELIPKDWGLSDSDQPEIWMFTVADETVVIEARPTGYLHGKFPCFIITYDIDCYSTNPVSIGETLKPLNDTLDWLVNTHFFNIRSSLNNRWIFDPSRVVTRDITKGTPEKFIRLKESAYGTDVRSVVTQFPVTDVTSGHLRDSQIISEMLQRVSGVTDNIMGMVNAGGRKTATEIRTSSNFGVNRLKTVAENWSMGDWGLLAQVILQNTQQYYSADKKFKIAGDLMEWNTESLIQVTPEDIQGFYDFVPVDGTLPVDRFAQANLWKEILAGVRNLPQVEQQYDVAGIFGWMSQLAGLKNIKRFKLETLPPGANPVAMGLTGVNNGNGTGGAPVGSSGGNGTSKLGVVPSTSQV